MIQNVKFMMILADHQQLNDLISSLFIIIRNNKCIQRIVKDISHPVFDFDPYIIFTHIASNNVKRMTC